MNSEAKRLHDEALALKPAGANHDSTLCPFCRTDVAQSQGTPSGSGHPDGSAATGSNTSSEGGTRHPMSDMSKETHEQLLTSAVAQVKAEKDAEIAKLTSERDALVADKANLEKTRDEQAATIKTLTDENTKVNAELDTAQVALKAATDEVATLKQEVAARDQKAQLAEVASKRVDQVKNLGLFNDDYASKKAETWAAMSDEAWAAQLEDYKALRGTSGGGDGGGQTTDTASALTGTSGDRGGDGGSDNASSNGGGTQHTPARKASRSLLGLN